VKALLDAGANCFFVPAGGDNALFIDAVKHHIEHPSPPPTLNYRPVFQIQTHPRCSLKPDQI